MRRIRAAIIGTGFMGSAHAEALKRLGEVDLACVASRSMDRARGLADAFGVENAVSDWREVLRDDSIDVVHNCTPNALHYDINRACIEAGKHIISEKPLAVSADQSRELLRMAEERNVVHAVNFNYRGYPIIREAREMVRSGALGEIHLIHGHYIQDWLLYASDYNWRLESDLGGASRAIADIGSHWCDLVQFISGLEIEAVFADLFTLHRERERPETAGASFEEGSGRRNRVSVDTEDGGSILIRFRGGARGATTISQVSAGRKNHQWFEIDGGERAIAWNQERPNELWIGNRGEPNQSLTKDPGLFSKAAANYAHYPGGHPEGYPDTFKNMFRDVYRFISENRKPGSGEEFPTFADGHRAVQLVEAVLESNRRGAWVEVGS